ncbi:hypothetical protein ABT300_22745, partial [Streptomyces sp. NPDC001027]|uniref:hypothetical protein n=1 Tax=Streptomyces sp. NPDC001027 TaxID=3154771 RepID=UPI00332503AE
DSVFMRRHRRDHPIQNPVRLNTSTDRYAEAFLGVLAERSCCGTVEMYVIPSFVGCDHGAAEAVGGQ